MGRRGVLDRFILVAKRIQKRRFFSHARVQRIAGQAKAAFAPASGPRLQGTPRALAGPPPEAGAKAREGRRAFGRCPRCQTRHEYDPPGRSARTARGGPGRGSAGPTPEGPFKISNGKEQPSWRFVSPIFVKS